MARTVKKGRKVIEWYLNSMYLINFAVIITISYAIGRWDGKRKEAKRYASIN